MNNTNVSLNTVIEEICKKEVVTEYEKNQLGELLKAIELKGGEKGFSFTSNRLILIGHHLLAFIRRIQNDSKLPPIESDLWKEISLSSKELSTEILQQYVQKQHKKLDSVEIFLLAVHFDVSKLE
ncbi:hypothetical protein [Thermoanaerobacterium thermosaccharolyticum]|uniref:PRD domain-containing protein n=2 Tax=Thermoanaerobacterium thermosaccharolyticum TaxID=1517 RepID=D9TQF4_THETC|nr:hypothetical protein [Thermoanaerobacterium thermosaccharolyticum]ADL69188.1 hypothetical protein Tthe_1682 [Thermoanaerobacterium thermosaccharolyticum DSM 571]AGB19321.1 hypothetical protein Thethe_01687 [Thermoanaerobacterium thermosaccharolyticum M0795]